MSKIRYEIETREGVSTTGPPSQRIVFVLNTSKDKIRPVSLIWQVFFIDKPKSRMKTETSRIADLSFLTALRHPKKLQFRRKKHGSSQTSL